MGTAPDIISRTISRSEERDMLSDGSVEPEPGSPVEPPGRKLGLGGERTGAMWKGRKLEVEKQGLKDAK